MSSKKERWPKEVKDEFRKAAEPLVKFLNERGNPNIKVIVDPWGAKLVSGEISITLAEFLRED